MRKLFALAGFAALAIAAFDAPAVAADKVKLGALRFTSHSAGFIAFEKGYFSDEGIDVDRGIGLVQTGGAEFTLPRGQRF